MLYYISWTSDSTHWKINISQIQLWEQKINLIHTLVYYEAACRYYSYKMFKAYSNMKVNSDSNINLNSLFIYFRCIFYVSISCVLYLINIKYFIHIVHIYYETSVFYFSAGYTIIWVLNRCAMHSQRYITPQLYSLYKSLYDPPCALMLGFWWFYIIPTQMKLAYWIREC